MEFDLLHPREQLTRMMKRLYDSKMTNLTGGNLSIHDDNGDIWITPSGIDKGNLRPEDIVCINENGNMIGHYAPSAELPFHTAIYEKRSDLKAAVHAHSPSLISYSIVRKVPDVNIIPEAANICGQVGLAPYALPGSDDLGKSIANTFAKGFDIVILENHGIAGGGEKLLEAINRLETLSFCATMLIKANAVGNVNTLSHSQIDLFNNREINTGSLKHRVRTSREIEIRNEIIKITRRACSQQLMTSTMGDISVRLDKDEFLITPKDQDRRLLEPQDLVLIKGEDYETDKKPGRSFTLHKAIYDSQPDVNSIITSHPPNMMAYAISDGVFNSKMIPESYVLLRDSNKFSFDESHANEADVAKVVGLKSPFAIIENYCIVVVGDELLNTFDRLEVAEFSAMSLIDSKSIGDLVPIGENDIQDLIKKFLS